MPKPVTVAGTIGDVLYHISCKYHGELGISASPEAAAQAAAAHLREQHRDLDGVVAPGADVQVVAVTHITPAHFEAIDAQLRDLGAPTTKPLS
jgi:hypothetical protein